LGACLHHPIGSSLQKQETLVLLTCFILMCFFRDKLLG
jgi:hypothetical protein